MSSSWRLPLAPKYEFACKGSLASAGTVWLITKDVRQGTTINSIGAGKAIMKDRNPLDYFAIIFFVAADEEHVRRILTSKILIGIPLNLEVLQHVAVVHIIDCHRSVY